MKLAAKGAEAVASYWAEFKDASSYKIVFVGNSASSAPALLTRVGEKPVGYVLRNKTSPGALVLLPDVDFDPPEFVQTKGNDEVWTAAARKFAARFTASIVGLDRALRAEGETTPMPSWAKASVYSLAPEDKLHAELLVAEREVERAVKRKERLQEDLQNVGRFRALLFEKGKPLEGAIIDALCVLGFSAAPFSNANSEFDVVFHCPDGRLIGEAEGKDNKAVSIDKLRQLSMNIHEDLQQATVNKPAKPVLFGNPYRLDPIGTRSDPFTEKCLSAASTSSTALVFTPDLFPPVRHLLSMPDEEYAKSCRLALITTVGRVSFPSPRSVQTDAELEVSATEKHL